jgi:hypothetical protein
MIDWQAFTPVSALIGGMFIGLAAGIFILLSGRIVGISGIVGGLLPPKAHDAWWRVCFVLGLLAAYWIYRLLAISGLPLPPVNIDIQASVYWLAMAGFLVGIGTRYGAGCTSGHGVCGLSRFSPRSMVATLLFMLTGFITVFVVRDVLLIS